MKKLTNHCDFINLGPVAEKNVGAFNVVTLSCHMKWGQPGFRLGCDWSTFVQQHFHDVTVATPACAVHRGQAVLNYEKQNMMNYN